MSFENMGWFVRFRFLTLTQPTRAAIALTLVVGCEGRKRNAPPLGFTLVRYI
ncbi:MAG: hypothetical protein AB4426_29915 [Xenococcaceae cyanobacterium]